MPQTCEVKQFRNVDLRWNTVAHYQFAGDPGVADLLAAGDINEVRRRIKARLDQPFIKAHSAQVRRFAREQ